MSCSSSTWSTGWQQPGRPGGRGSRAPERRRSRRSALCWPSGSPSPSAAPRTDRRPASGARSALLPCPGLRFDWSHRRWGGSLLSSQVNRSCFVSTSPPKAKSHLQTNYQCFRNTCRMKLHANSRLDTSIFFSFLLLFILPIPVHWVCSNVCLSDILPLLLPCERVHAAASLSSDNWCSESCSGGEWKITVKTSPGFLAFQGRMWFVFTPFSFDCLKSLPRARTEVRCDRSHFWETHFFTESHRCGERIFFFFFHMQNILKQSIRPAGITGKTEGWVK